MPSSGAEDWERLHQDLSRHEKDRDSLGYPKDPPSRVDRESSSQLGEVPNIPRYEILARLGEGATAVVYRAMDRELHRPVALKVQRQSMALSEVAGQRFRREAQAAAGLSHPNVVTVHDAGEEQGRHYLVMELVEGRPLSEILKEGGKDPKALLRLLQQAAQGVAAAHEKGIVHRDLKPSNILVTATGEPKVADFGLAHLVDSTAQLTKTGSSLGTPLYMSPEQVEGRVRDISPRTDVYSLGAILYEIVTGRAPQEGETMMEIYGKIVRDDPLPLKSLNPEAPDAIQTVALKALEKDPQRRYPTAREFAEDLGRYLAGEPVLARPLGRTHRLYRRLRKSPLARGLAIVLAVGLLTTGAVVVAVHEKSGRLLAEREKRLTLLREHARTSLEAVLKLRRAGANQAMMGFVPGLEAAYRQALESAPESAEVEYLMGRMQRALMADEKALAYQENALRKEAAYGPALYERAVLLANRYGSGLSKAVAEARRLPPGPVTAESSRSIPLPDPQDVEIGQQDLVAFRESILKDCTVLESMPSRDGDARVLTVKGILAFCRLAFPEARSLLEEAVRKDPTLEEAWSTLCETVYRQANIEARRSSSVEEVLRRYDEAEALYEKAISNDAGYAPHWVGRADTRRHRAFYLMSRGKDCLKSLLEAEADLSQALKLFQDNADAWMLRGAVRIVMGVYRMDHVQSPVKELAAAEEDLRVAVSRWGDRPTAWSHLGSLHLEQARWRRRSGESPLAEYAAAEEVYGQALKIDPLSVESLTNRGMVRMYRGEWRSARGIDPLKDFAAAEEDFNEVLRMARHTTRPWEAQGQLRSFRGSYRLAKGEDGLEDLNKAEKDFTEALALAPANARLLAQRGRVRGHLAGLVEKSDPSRAVRLCREAGSDFKSAFELNGSLESEYASASAEAKKRLAKLQP